MSGAHAGNAPEPAALERALRDEGVHGRVEAHDRLAIVIPDAAATPAIPEATEWLVSRAARERTVALARAHGFTHVAIELPAAPAAPTSSRAGLPGA